MEAIFFTVMTIFSVIGIATVIQWLAGRFLSDAKNQHLISIIPCDGHREDVEYLVKNTYVRMTDQCRCKNCSIILVDCGMDTETRNICNMLVHDLDFVKICGRSEIGTFVQENFHCKSSDFVI